MIYVELVLRFPHVLMLLSYTFITPLHSVKTGENTIVFLCLLGCLISCLTSFPVFLLFKMLLNKTYTGQNPRITFPGLDYPHP